MKENREKIRSLTRTSLLCALMCVSAFITIPLPVPITLQTLVLFFSLFAVGGRATTAVTLLYTAIGALGLPVFSGFSGGVARLFDATGGFIFGMIFASLVFWLAESILPNLAEKKLLLSAVSLAVIYLVGALWYFGAYLGGEDFFASLAVTVLPFILPDAVKISLAYLIAKKLKKFI